MTGWRDSGAVRILPMGGGWYCSRCNTGFDVEHSRCPLCQRTQGARGGLSRMRRRKHRVIERDGRCLRCGTRGGLTVDHVVPRSLGGSNAESNLQTLCGRCNRAKADTIVDYRTASGGAASEEAA